MASDPRTYCDEETFAALLARLGDDGGVDAVEIVLQRYPDDPRLHFLNGSVLAADRRYAEARAAMGAALDRAPDMGIARFQMGLLEFTAGEVEPARRTWAALEALSDGDALRLFAQGLLHLADGETADGAALVERGMAVNETNPVLNRNIRLLVDAMTSASGGEPEAAPTSATDMLLRQFGQNGAA